MLYPDKHHSAGQFQTIFLSARELFKYNPARGCQKKERRACA